MATVRDMIRKKGYDVFTIAPEATVFEALEMMAKHNIGALLVMTGDEIKGIVSERDLYRLGDRFLQNTDKARLRARDIMRDDPYVVGFDTPLNKVALEMAKRRIGSAIILHHEKLAGILSATDICRLLAEILESEFSPGTGDDAA